MNFALFGRFFLEFAMMYPAEYLCLASLQEHLRAPRKTYAIGASAITLMGLAGAAVCCMLDMETNFLLIPLLIISFWLLRWRTDREVSISQTMFLFSVSAVMMSVCTLLAIVLNAEAELDNAQPVFLPSTSVICLTLSVILSAIFRFTAVRWSRWLLQEYHGEAFWESAWPLPALYAAFLVFCMPKEIGVILMNRIRIIAVLAVSISLLGIFLLLYEMYRVAKEYARSSQLDRENQLLAVESRRYMELRSYLEQTRHLRHDFRQHLHVISGLTEAGRLDELKSYLSQLRERTQRCQTHPVRQRCGGCACRPLRLRGPETGHPDRMEAGTAQAPAPAGGRPVHHSWQPAGKCAPCQPEAAAGRTAGQGAGPDAQPGHDGPDGGEPL